MGTLWNVLLGYPHNIDSTMGTSITTCQVLVHKEMTTNERWVVSDLLPQVYAIAYLLQDHPSILSGTLIHE